MHVFPHYLTFFLPFFKSPSLFFLCAFLTLLNILLLDCVRFTQTMIEQQTSETFLCACLSFNILHRVCVGNG